MTIEWNENNFSLHYLQHCFSSLIPSVRIHITYKTILKKMVTNIFFFPIIKKQNNRETNISLLIILSEVRVCLHVYLRWKMSKKIRILLHEINALFFFSFFLVPFCRSTLQKTKNTERQIDARRETTKNCIFHGSTCSTKGKKQKINKKITKKNLFTCDLNISQVNCLNVNKQIATFTHYSFFFSVSPSFPFFYLSLSLSPK